MHALALQHITLKTYISIHKHYMTATIKTSIASLRYLNLCQIPYVCTNTGTKLSQANSFEQLRSMHLLVPLGHQIWRKLPRRSGDRRSGDYLNRPSDSAPHSSAGTQRATFGDGAALLFTSPARVISRHDSVIRKWRVSDGVRQSRCADKVEMENDYRKLRLMCDTFLVAGRAWATISRRSVG